METIELLPVRAQVFRGLLEPAAAAQIERGVLLEQLLDIRISAHGHRKARGDIGRAAAIVGHPLGGGVVVGGGELQRPVVHDGIAVCGGIEIRCDGDVRIDERAAADAAGSKDVNLVERIVAIEGLGAVAPQIAEGFDGVQVCSNDAEEVKDSSCVIRARPPLNLLRIVGRGSRDKFRQRALGREPPDAAFEHEDVLLAFLESELRGGDGGTTAGANDDDIEIKRHADLLLEPMDHGTLSQPTSFAHAKI